MKAGAMNLRALATELEPEEGRQALQNITQESLTSLNYGHLMNLLHNTMVSNKAKFKSKKRRISDKDKHMQDNN